VATPFKQVCAQLGDLRTLKTWHCPHLLLCAVLLRRRPCSNRSISPTRRAHSSKHAARCCSGRMGQTDGRTDGHTDGHRTVSWTLLRILCSQCKQRRKKSHSDIAIGLPAPCILRATRVQTVYWILAASKGWIKQTYRKIMHTRCTQNHIAGNDLVQIEYKSF